MVAAVLSPSGALGGVAEAFGVHEISRQISANVVTVDSVDQGLAVGGALFSPVRPASLVLSNGTPRPSDIGSGSTYSAQVGSSLSPRSTGNATLDRLTVLSGPELATFVAGNPTAVQRLLLSPPRASSVATWWGAIPNAEQKTLATSAPQVIGNLDGVPVTVRDVANRLTLARSVAKLERSIDSGVGRAKLIEKRHQLDTLNQVTKTLERPETGTKRQLLTLDPTGEVRAAVVVGDLATADYVSYLVPGMFFTVQGQMYDWTVIAQDLQAQQAAWLATLSSRDPTLSGKTAATVSWIGYATPGVLDIASLDRAKIGAKFLGNAIQGIRAVRSESQPFVSLVTHSYGSTAAMMELANGGMTVDALAIIGSPGSAAQSAAALAVKNGNVFVGEAAWDPIVNTAFYGSDPGSRSFGARKMEVAATTDPITGKPLAAAVGHLGYFDTGTTAMRNLALIGLDQGALVSSGSSTDAQRTGATTR
ncbi:MAG: alpha/beta hydrolase [Actinomycetota bacterium]